jgi:hypothetical protein
MTRSLTFTMLKARCEPELPQRGELGLASVTHFTTRGCCVIPARMGPRSRGLPTTCQPTRMPVCGDVTAECVRPVHNRLERIRAKCVAALCLLRMTPSFHSPPHFSPCDMEDHPTAVLGMILR